MLVAKSHEEEGIKRYPDLGLTVDRNRGTYTWDELVDRWPAYGKLRAGESFSVSTVTDAIPKSWFTPWAVGLERKAIHAAVESSLESMLERGDSAAAALEDATRILDSILDKSTPYAYTTAGDDASADGTEAHEWIARYAAAAAATLCPVERALATAAAVLVNFPKGLNEARLAFDEFSIDEGFIQTFSEKAINYGHGVLRYSGTYDALGFSGMDDDPTSKRSMLLDYKYTNRISLSNKVQVCMYGEAVGADRVAILRLPKGHQGRAANLKRCGKRYDLYEVKGEERRACVRLGFAALTLLTEYRALEGDSWFEPAWKSGTGEVEP